MPERGRRRGRALRRAQRRNDYRRGSAEGDGMKAAAARRERQPARLQRRHRPDARCFQWPDRDRAGAARRQGRRHTADQRGRLRACQTHRARRNISLFTPSRSCKSFFASNNRRRQDSEHSTASPQRTLQVDPRASLGSPGPLKPYLKPCPDCTSTALSTACRTAYAEQLWIGLRLVLSPFASLTGIMRPRRPPFSPPPPPSPPPSLYHRHRRLPHTAASSPPSPPPPSPPSPYNRHL